MNHLGIIFYSVDQFFATMFEVVIKIEIFIKLKRVL
jgi:hypothetical protein